MCCVNDHPSFLGSVLQYVKMVEKGLEATEISFHLLAPLLAKCLNKENFNSLNNVHKGAHHYEHILHSFCILNDLEALYNGKFIERSDHGKKIELLQTLGKTIHAVSHLFATAIFLKEKNIIKLGIVEKIAQCHLLFSAVGFAITSLGLLLKKPEAHPHHHAEELEDLEEREALNQHNHHHAQEPNHHKSNLMMNISGFVFDIVECGLQVKGAETVGNIAGLVHSYSVTKRILQIKRFV